MIVGCPSCGVPLDVPKALLGTTVMCASCANIFQTAAPASGADQSAWAAAPPYREPRPVPRRAFRDDDDAHEDVSWARGPRRDLLPHRGGMVLALGIVSVSLSPLSFCGIFGFVFGIAGLAVGIPGLVLASSDLRAIRSGRMDPDGLGMTNAGWICAIIGTCLSGMAMLIALLLLMAWGRFLWPL
jgi:hypothetical protein